MMTLDELKKQLSELKQGESAKVHEMTVAEVLQGARKSIGVLPSADTEFEWWCEDNHLTISHSGVSDYFVFEKSNA